MMRMRPPTRFLEGRMVQQQRRRVWVTLMLGLAAVLVAASCGTGQTPTETPIPPSTPVQEEIALELGPLAPLPGQEIELASDWRFAIDERDAGVRELWFGLEFDDTYWTPVTVPHTWNVMPQNWEYEGVAWYRRTFMLPEQSANALVRLRFEAVYYMAQVWVNGTLIGMHEGGYTPFEMDISGVALPGQENTVAVRVDNLRARDRIPAVLAGDWSFDWWNYGGLVRDVTLHITSRAIIAGQRIVAVPHLTGMDQADSAVVDVEVTVYNASDRNLEATLTGDVLDDDTDLSMLGQNPQVVVNVPAGGRQVVSLQAEISSPKLWHFDHPALYRWSCVLALGSGEVLHSREDVFGVRLVELKEARLLLNGEPVRLVGLTRHADSPEHGLAETATVMAADYDDLKRLNMVFSRPVHYPQAESIYDYCDRNGILLIPEVPSWQLRADQMAEPNMRELEKQQLGEMIEAAFNHPSVWAWSVGNELQSDHPDGHSFVQEMVAYVHSVDPTRPVGFASYRLYENPEQDATRFTDFVLMNQYFGTWGGPKQGLSEALDEIHQTWPDKVVIISEFGFESHWNGPWGPPSSELDAEDYYFIDEDLPAESEAADVQRRMVIDEQMDTYRSQDFVVGAIFWTYQDYRTRTGFVMGVVDAERNRRGSWDLLRGEFSPVLIQGLVLSPGAGGELVAEVTLRTRGPLEEDMPVYTLRGYTLRLEALSAESGEILSHSEIPLPDLAPASTWRGGTDLQGGGEDCLVRITVVRPTGFEAVERLYDAQGFEAAAQ